MEAHGRASAGVLPFDILHVDAYIPGGGLALGYFHEVMEGGPASEYAGLAILFAAGIAARLTGPVLWCLRGRDLFASAASSTACARRCSGSVSRTVRPSMSRSFIHLSVGAPALPFGVGRVNPRVADRQQLFHAQGGPGIGLSEERPSDLALHTANPVGVI